MALLPERQIFSVTTGFSKPFAGARGGILTLSSFSGVFMPTYATNPSGLPALGILMHDVERMFLHREYDPGGFGRGLREVVQPDDLIGAISEGEIVTDFIDPNATNVIRPGIPAYVGPSGLITAHTHYGGVRIGTFLSTVGSSHLGLPQHDTGQVLFMGGGLEYTIQEPITHKIVTFNSERVWAVTPGYAKVRVEIGRV